MATVSVPSSTPFSVAPASGASATCSPWYRETLIAYALLFLLACLPYINTLGNGFVYDDHQHVENNPFVLYPSRVLESFTADLGGYAGMDHQRLYFRPFMTFTHFLIWRIYGPMPMGFHIVNVLLAGAVASAIFAVVLRWTGDQALAFASGVIFALHPAHSEVVAWITDVTDLECTFFCLCTLWFLLGLRSGQRRTALHLVAASVCCLLALLSKEAAISLPLLGTLFVFLDQEFRAKWSARSRILCVVPLWCVAFLYLVARSVVLGSVSTAWHREGVGFWQTIFTGLALLAGYVEKFFWPVHLCVFYVIPEHKHLDGAVVAGVLLLGLMVMAMILTVRRRPLISFGLAWFLAMLAPALNLRWLLNSPFAERYLFLPSVGLCWAIADCAVYLWRRWLDRPKAPALLRSVTLCFLGLLLVLAVIRIWTRNRDWHDDMSLFTRTIEQEPRATMMRANLAASLWDAGRKSDAVKEWRQVLYEKPHYLLALTNLARVSMAQNDFAAAEAYVNEALQFSPKSAAAWRSLGQLRLKEGRTAEAEEAFLRDVDLDPFDGQGRADLGYLLLSSGRLEEAAVQFERATYASPEFGVWTELGEVYWKLGRVADAERAFRSALDSSSLDDAAHAGLGRIHERRGELAKARREYQASLLTNPHNSDALAGLARLNASGGK